MRRAAAQCELDGPRMTGPMTSLKMLTVGMRGKGWRGAATSGEEVCAEKAGRGLMAVARADDLFLAAGPGLGLNLRACAGESRGPDK